MGVPKKMKDELKVMAEGFRWGRRPLVPRSAEEHAQPKVDRVFPSDWARTDAGVAARQVLLKGAMHPRPHGRVRPAEPAHLAPVFQDLAGDAPTLQIFPVHERPQVCISLGT